MKEAHAKLLITGVFLTCSGVFAVLAVGLTTIGANSSVAGVLFAIATLVSMASFGIAFALAYGLIRSRGGERGKYADFIAEDPARRDLSDSEFRRQFKVWRRVQEQT